MGSKALTHQQVPFSPFISSLSSRLPLFLLSSRLSAPLFSVHLPYLFTSSIHHCFPLPHFVFSFFFPSYLFLSVFLFGFAPSCPLFPCNPPSSLSFSLSIYLCALSSLCLFNLPPPIFPLFSLSSYTPPSLLLLLHNLLTLHFPVSFTLSSLFLPSPHSQCPPFLHSICFSLLITLCSPRFQRSTS